MTTPNPPSAAGALMAAKMEKLHGHLERLLPEIERARPRGLEARRFARILVTEVTRNPELLECTQASLLRALLQSAQLGLYPDSQVGHAYLIPFKDKKKDTLEAQLLTGYKGLVVLAYRSGQVAQIAARVVHENEPFELEFGSNERLVHKPCLHGEPGDPYAVYMYAKIRGGGEVIEILTRADVEKARRASKAPDSPAWKNWEPEMWRKTAMRRGAKWLPLSSEDARLIAREEAEDLPDAPSSPLLELDDGRTIDVEKGEVSGGPKKKNLKDKYKPEATPTPDPTVCASCGVPVAANDGTPLPAIHRQDCALGREPGQD
jgi:recombination protein RecT